MSIVLTADQQAAYSEMVTLLTTQRKELVVNGLAGCGKTTLVKTFLDEWPQLVAISGGTFKDAEVYLTATTNKAADALSSATGRETATIHSLLGLRVKNVGYRDTQLLDTGKEVPDGCLIIIDEASFIDEKLLSKIRQKTKRSKVIYLGDPCQLKPVGSDDTPVFTAGIPTVNLKQIVRQSDDSPIQKLSRALRDHVDGSPMPSAGVDGIHIFHLPKDEFEKSLIEDCRIGAGNSVRALAWTNQVAIGYNEMVAHALSGNPELKLGDTAVVNKQVQKRGYYKLPTDSTVYIQGLSNWKVDSNGIESREVETSYGFVLRQAREYGDVIALIKKAFSENNSSLADQLVNLYVDLRLMYASTVNKSQGSTYDTVYIDLNDIGKCRDKDQVRRMLYVAVSRARHKVVFTGDI